MATTKEKIQFTLNGERQAVEVNPEIPLLYVLRNEMALSSPKYGCGLGQCGACMILLDGQAMMSCVIPSGTVKGKIVKTLNGLTTKNDQLHPVQQAFLDEQAAQCGYCTNGMIIAAVSLLEQNPEPNDQEIKQALQNNLCRCGTQSRVIRAINRAAQNI